MIFPFRRLAAKFLPRLLLKLGALFQSRHAALALACYREAARLHPADARAAFLLGRLLLLQGNMEAAGAAFKAALRARPDYAEAHNNLGVALYEQGQVTEAADCYRAALRLKPDYAAACNNLGNVQLSQARAAEAEAGFRQALRIDAGYAEAHNNLGLALRKQGRHEEAEQSLRQALRINPGFAGALSNLGSVLLNQGKIEEAVNAYQEALRLQPDLGEAHANLAIVLGDTSQLAAAITYYEKLLRREPNSPEAHNLLAIGYLANRSQVKAEQACREILTRHPESVLAYMTLGNVLSQVGETGWALDAYQQALALKPGDFRVHSNILFVLNYFSGYSTRFIFEKHLEWAARHERPLAEQRKSHSPDKDKNRRLKVGYVSSDFTSHPVGCLIRGVIRHHDKERFEIHCYAPMTRPDQITEEIRRNADLWHDTTSLNDAELANRVWEDKIDILVDLAGHTGRNRLLLFARKPAPVQVTWVGYFHSTGLESIDYFITDPYTSPPHGEQYFSEIPVYLPHTRFCYTPPEYAPPVADPPCLKNGFVTLGCFNKLEKMTDEVVSAWAHILERLPDARLWLKSGGLNEPTVCEKVHGKFAALGIAPERIVLKPPSGHSDMFMEYGEIDIALDPFPYNGGITTFEALWMGVPVVTLAREGVVARQSASALTNLGLTDLIHETIPSYIEGVVKLASDKQRLVELRQLIRPTMEHSPLCDIHAFVGDLEHLYRRMWCAWSDGGKLPSDLGQHKSSIAYVSDPRCVLDPTYA